MYCVMCELLYYPFSPLLASTGTSKAVIYKAKQSKAEQIVCSQLNMAIRLACTSFMFPPIRCYLALTEPHNKLKPYMIPDSI